MGKKQLYRIAWRSRITGKGGHGEFMEKSLAEAFLEEAKKEHGQYIDHWLEGESESQKKNQ